MKPKLLFAGTCVVCATLSVKAILAFEGSEFASGGLVGNQVGAAPLFVLAGALVMKFRRSAALLALLATYWSLPLYLYLVFPGPFRRNWPGEWKSIVPPGDTFVWDGWWITGILSTLLAVTLSVYFLIRANHRQPPSQPVALGTAK